jgi:predicted Zn-dependent peptidase
MTDIHQSTLPNGLRVVLCPDDSVPLVGLSMLYDVGSRNEIPGASGFAHLFEHMMFQGSEHVPKGDFIRRVHALGGLANGSTSRERTNFYLSLPAHQLGLGLWLEADRMRALTITEENFENQRQTVLEERLQRVDNSPYGEAQVRILELSYSQFAYGHPVIGYRADLESAQMGAVQSFHDTWYRPDNVVLSIAGDVDVESTLEWVHEFFGGLARGGKRPALQLAEPRRMQTVLTQIEDRMARMPALFVNHQSVPYSDPDFFVYEVIETLLFRGPSSRLIRRMVIDESAAIQVAGGYEAHRGPSLFSFFAILPEQGDPGRLAEMYQEELERLASEPVDEVELEKVCNQLRSSRIFGHEAVVSRATSLARSVLYHHDAQWEDRYLERIQRVTVADIQRVAARDFDPDGRVILEVRPR